MAIDSFSEQNDFNKFQSICTEHSAVIPAESYQQLDDSDTQFRLIAQLQQKAIALENEVEKQRVATLLLKQREKELRIANEFLTTSKEAAEVANKTKSTFLATMSHEVRTPLSAILGFAQLLLQEELSVKERIDAADVIIDNGKRLTQLLNDILDLSKVESGQLNVKKTPFSTAEFLRDIGNILGLLAQQRGVDLRIFWEGFDPAQIISDALRLHQIVINLGTNALKFSNSKPVEIAFRYFGKGLGGSEETLQITVKDYGKGIADEEQSNLFQPFHQGDSSFSREHGGTGLGLFLSRQLARLLGGNITLAHSRLNEGSTFVITIQASSVTSTLHNPTEKVTTNGFIT